MHGWLVVMILALVPAIVIAGTISVVALASLTPSSTLRRHVRAMLPLLTAALRIAARKPGEEAVRQVVESITAGRKSGRQPEDGERS